MAINLLPPKYKTQQSKGSKDIINVNLFLLLFLCLLIFGGIFLYDRELNSKINALEAHINNLKPITSKWEEHEKSKEFMDKRALNSDILSDLTSALNDEIWFVQIQKGNEHLIIEGEALNFAAIANLAIKFESFQWISQVEVNNAQRVNSDWFTYNVNNNLPENISFTITAEFAKDLSLFVTPERSELE